MQPTVTPYVGVWIETLHAHERVLAGVVTPYVGVWIETFRMQRAVTTTRSLLMWECGLKPLRAAGYITEYCHSLCGSVD